VEVDKIVPVDEKNMPCRRQKVQSPKALLNIPPRRVMKRIEEMLDFL
jgi:hypothetical protein